jgi:hypothetical protein
MPHKRRHKLTVYTPYSKMTTSFESKAAAVAERKRLREAWKKSKLIALGYGVSFSLEKE